MGVLHPHNPRNLRACAKTLCKTTMFCVAIIFRSREGTKSRGAAKITDKRRPIVISNNLFKTWIQKKCGHNFSQGWWRTSFISSTFIPFQHPYQFLNTTVPILSIFFYLFYLLWSHYFNILYLLKIIFLLLCLVSNLIYIIMLYFNTSLGHMTR